MGSLVLTGDTSGSVTVAVPAVAGTNTATFPAATGTVMVAGNMPAFSATGTTQSAPTNNTDTKLIFGTKTGTFGFDTNSNYDAVTNYRFTPTVAGYYQVNAAIQISGVMAATYANLKICKNGTANNLQIASANSASNPELVGSVIIYLNGSTDYIEAYQFQSGTPNATNNLYFQACLVRGA